VYGEFIRQVRLAAGLSQGQLADLAGTSQPTISAYEHDRRVPTLHALNKLVAACGFVLCATAGSRQVRCPLPQAGGFPDEEPRVSGDDTGHAARVESDRSPDERARRLEAVLDLADDLRTSRAAHR
jgi:transcriptional regulator with XRE-family HTH domain